MTFNLFAWWRARRAKKAQAKQAMYDASVDALAELMRADARKAFRSKAPSKNLASFKKWQVREGSRSRRVH